MLRWCSYCQRFQGEAPPYERLNLTHGICLTCEAKVADFTDRDAALARTLQSVQHQLAEAGRSGDLARARQVIDVATRANVAAVDIMLGLIAPLLFQTGEDWKQARISVADEHRFTSFCEALFELVAAGDQRAISVDAPTTGQVDALLVNASGNQHTLAIRILALWLVDRGVRARVVISPLSPEAVAALVSTVRPQRLLVSMALAEHRANVERLVEGLAALPDPTRPQVIVGGYAVKMGLVQAIPGAELMADIGSLTRPSAATRGLRP